jgi:hypothetical protein
MCYDKQDEINRYNDCYMVLSDKMIFIRYNPDSKNSDKLFLLEIIKKYLILDIEDNIDIFDDFGLKTEYLYY